MIRRRQFTIIGSAVISGILAGCIGGSGEPEDDFTTDELTGDEDMVIEFNVQRFDRLQLPNGDVLESTDDTQYVGVQLRVTNHTEMPQNISMSWIDLYADGVAADSTMHESSQTEPLSGIPAGETIDTYLVFTVRPDASLDFRETPFSLSLDMGLQYDADLELELTEA